MVLQDKNIAIIGAGPGGLTLATLLQEKGAAVKVYERDINRGVRVKGGPLDLHTESGLAALEKAGLMNAFKENYRPDADRTRMVDEKATVFYDDHNDKSIKDFGDNNFRPEIDRTALRMILLDSLQAGTVVWDSHIISIERIDNQWNIIFQNGLSATADIVIGADGANSKIRPFVTPIKPFYSGITILEGNIHDYKKSTSTINALFRGGKIQGLGDSKTITVGTKADGSLGFNLSWKEEVNWLTDSGIDFKNGKQVLNWFKKEYSNWNSVWHELFEYDSSDFIPRPLYCMPLDQHWEAQPTITLLGDAAHLMPPFAGEGVNMAMLDALQLSENLTNGQFTDLKSAIADYEKQMFARFAIIGKITLDNGEWMHSPEGLKKMLLLKSRK